MAKKKTEAEEPKQDNGILVQTEHKQEIPISLVAAGGQEVRKLVLQWHEQGKEIKKEALVQELARMFPRAVSPKTGKEIDQQGWFAGVNSVIQELRSKGQIPRLREPRMGAGSNNRGNREPTVGDLRKINEYLVKEHLSTGAFIEQLEKIGGLCKEIGSLEELTQCVRALEDFSS